MIRILVDSASDILNNNKENITVVPLKVNIDNTEYIDGVNLGHDEFYNLLISSREFPKTSQPSPQDFVTAFEAAKENQDELICIMLSSGVSGTYQSACLAKAIVEYDKIHVVDSLSGAYGIYILVQKAQTMIQQGASAKEIVEEIETLKKRIRIFLSVETLEYLYRGGRLDKTAAVIGGIAKVKPVITISKEGKVEVVAKAIGMVRAMNSIVGYVNEIQPDKQYPLYTICTLGTNNVEKLERKLKESGIEVSEREQLGPVVGSHVGPEAFGVIFIEA